MSQISSNDLNAHYEKIAKEFHHLHRRLNEIQDSFDRVLLLKDQNSEIPVILEKAECLLEKPESLSCASLPGNTPPTQVNTETPWLTPKRSTRARENHPSSFPQLSNRFQGLQIFDCNPEEYEVQWPTASSQDNRVKPSVKRDTSRRPAVVTSKFPENDDPSRYRKAKPKKKNITLVVDSMVKFRVSDWNQDLKNFGIDNVWSDICKFPAATACQIADYTPRSVKENKADGLLVHSGTNSVSRKTEDGELRWTDEEIAKQIIDTGIQAKIDGVRNVLISGLILRRGKLWCKNFKY